MKNRYRGGDYLKRGAWTVCRFKGELGKKEGVVFLRGEVDTPMHTMIIFAEKCFSLSLLLPLPCISNSEIVQISLNRKPKT